MKKQEHNGLYELFVEELADMYSAEKQILKALPKLISKASLPDLREALSHHLKETENQVKRIKQICSLLDIECEEKQCQGMEGILKEGDEVVAERSQSPICDAAIISAAQKVEHYEIASYGTLRSFAKQLDFDDEVADLLQASLDEEGAADHKLTKLAEGSFFSSGVNQEAMTAGSSKTKK